MNIWCAGEKMNITFMSCCCCRGCYTLVMNDNCWIWEKTNHTARGQWLLTMSQLICAKYSIHILGIRWFIYEKRSNDVETQCSQLLVNYGYLHSEIHLSIGHRRMYISCCHEITIKLLHLAFYKNTCFNASMHVIFTLSFALFHTEIRVCIYIYIYI